MVRKYDLELVIEFKDEKRWNMLYMGYDASHTRYIDLASQTFF